MRESVLLAEESMMSLSQQSHINYKIRDRVVYNNFHETIKLIIGSIFGERILTIYKLF